MDKVNQATKKAEETVVNKAQEGIKKAESALGQTHGQPHKISAMIDIGIFAVGVLETVLFFLGGDYLYFGLWWLMAVAVAAKGGFSLFVAGVHNTPAEAPKKIISSTEGLYCLLGAAIVFLAPSAMLPYIVAMTIHALLDLVTVQRPALRQLIPGFEQKAGSIVDKITPSLQSTMLVTAAACEIIATILVPFYGSLIMLAIHLSFLFLRYKGDSSVQKAYGHINATIEKGTNHASCPPAIRNGYATFKDNLKKIQ